MEASLAQYAHNFCYFLTEIPWPNVTFCGMAPTGNSVTEDVTFFSQVTFHPSALTFLSTTTLNPVDVYSTSHPLHDKATKMACAYFKCPAEDVTLTPKTNLTFFLCTYDKVVQENEIIYETASLTSTTLTP